MTKEQLTEMLKTLVGPMVAEAVHESMSKAAEAQKATAQTIHDLFAAHAQSQKQADAVPKGTFMSRVIQALAMSKGDPFRAAEMAKKHWPDPMGQTVSKALSASDNTAGGYAVPPDYRQEFIELLRPASVVRSANPLVVPMPNGQFSMPKLTGGATAAYIAENANIPTSQQTTGLVKLVAKKLVAMVPVSNDLLRYASPQTDNIIRDDSVAAVSQREDLAFIRGDGSVDTPIGMKGFTPSANIITVNATVNLANVTQDLGRILLALLNADVRMLRPCWFMAPRTEIYLMTVRDANGNFAFRPEMLSGSLWGYPYKRTTQIPINLAVTGTNESELYLADMADMVVGEAQAIQVDVSDTAAYYDSTLGSVQASFSRDQSVVRVITEHDFGVRHDAAVAYAKDVDWTP